MVRKLAIVGAGAVLVLASACTKQSAPVTTMHVSAVSQDAKASVFEQVDLGKQGFGPADQLIEVAPETTPSGSALGSAYTTVTILSGSKLEEAWGMIDCSVDLSGGSVLF